MMTAPAIWRLERLVSHPAKYARIGKLFSAMSSNRRLVAKPAQAVYGKRIGAGLHAKYDWLFRVDQACYQVTAGLQVVLHLAGDPRCWRVVILNCMQLVHPP